MPNLSKTRLGNEFKPPTQDRLHQLLRYDPDSGQLFWRKRRKGVPFDDAPAGCIADGYVKVSIDGTQFKAHHVIWCMMTGEWIDFIDHEDVDGTNNRWRNLRRSTVAENNRNVGNKKTERSASPLKGAYFDKRRGLWHSRIMVNRKLQILGYFNSAEEAHAAYTAAANLLHGAFARTT